MKTTVIKKYILLYYSIYSTRFYVVMWQQILYFRQNLLIPLSLLSVPTIERGGDTTIMSPGKSPKQSLTGIGLHDPLHGQQACPEFNSFYLRVGHISLREGLFSICPLQKRGQICDIPVPPNL